MHDAGIAGGVLNTARQIGGALAVAVFGALLAGHGGLLHGLRVSLLIAAALLVVSAAATSLLRARPNSSASVAPGRPPAGTHAADEFAPAAS